MISPLLIVISAVIAAAAVAVSARYVRWPVFPALVATAGTLVLVIAWRLLANVLSLNDDFMPAVSIGDAGCLLAGGLPPLLAAAANRPVPPLVLPAVTGALVAFIVNVIIL